VGKVLDAGIDAVAAKDEDLEKVLDAGIDIDTAVAP
jgi:hypothetical protein